MSTIIKIENVSKQYRLGSIGTNTLKGDLQRWWFNMRGLPDPTLIIGQENALINRNSNSSNDEYIWALKDISFDVQQGEVLGIIGKNGAGKSTLLKLLSRVTSPTTGNIKVKGRIASLLEVGTGFHPELTGRENIYLNGAILGMTKTEIRSKLDEIVDFAGIAKYIDTPVKRYSSGMYVRLAFAVAAHLEPEILIIDEVLAVGDAEFQKKAVGKMRDISSGEGRTVLFVSHNMAAINDLCNRGILLNCGAIILNDAVNVVVREYLAVNSGLTTHREWLGDQGPGCENIKLSKACIINNKYESIEIAYINQEIGFQVEYRVLEDTPFFTHGINVYNNMDTHLFTSHDSLDFERKNQISKGQYRTIVWIPANLLQNDKIEFSFACMRYNPFEVLFHERKLISINILETQTAITRNENYRGVLPGIIRPTLKWETRTFLND